jgi:hypothetical protein
MGREAISSRPIGWKPSAASPICLACRFRLVFVSGACGGDLRLLLVDRVLRFDKRVLEVPTSAILRPLEILARHSKKLDCSIQWVVEQTTRVISGLCHRPYISNDLISEKAAQTRNCLPDCTKRMNSSPHVIGEMLSLPNGKRIGGLLSVIAQTRDICRAAS